MVGNILDAYESLKRTVKQPGFTSNYSETEYPSWYNVFDFEQVRENIRQLITCMYKGDQYEIWGFKEIRFGLEADYEKFSSQLDNFSELFPNCKFVFLFRKDLEAQLKSAWWADNTDESRVLLKNQLEFFNRYYSQHKNNSYILSLEDMITMNDIFWGMFAFLNNDFDLDVIKGVLNNNLDYDNISPES
jgi:hypothetical protein